MISNLRLKFAAAPNITPKFINITPITVFVGPNNSGKSKVLAEIKEYCSTGQKDSRGVILDEIRFAGLSEIEATYAISQITMKPNLNEAIPVNHIVVGGRNGRFVIPLDDLSKYVQAPSIQIQAFCQWFLRHSTLMLDGSGRIGHIHPQSAGDLQESPNNSLQVLFRDNVKRSEVRRIIAEAFGNYFVVDPTLIGNLRIRLSERAPINEQEERGIHEEAVEFHGAAQLIDQASDGVKAFTGIVTELIAGDPRIVLIDEPEAFLHPSLAYKLGNEVSRIAQSSNKRVFISTHSASFVMGCIQSGVPVNIVRLTYRNSVATARVLPSNELIELMRNPLLRSTGVLNGLFYEFVIITEADSDRAFYQEVNDRLQRFKPEWGIPNCLFLNAQNKQTEHIIIKPLRKLGIPAVSIVDIDVLKEGGNNWSNLLHSANVPEITRKGFEVERDLVEKAMKATSKNMKRDGGTSILIGAQKESADNLLAQLREYGIFIISGGELESWLKELGAAGHGSNWLVDIFEKMGEDPNQPNYIMPSDSDVWEFISKIKDWLIDPNRKGIPI